MTIDDEVGRSRPSTWGDDQRLRADRDGLSAAEGDRATSTENEVGARDREGYRGPGDGDDTAWSEGLAADDDTRSGCCLGDRESLRAYGDCWNGA